MASKSNSVSRGSATFSRCGAASIGSSWQELFCKELSRGPWTVPDKDEASVTLKARGAAIGDLAEDFQKSLRKQFTITSI
jgi:hypothetical protein